MHLTLIISLKGHTRVHSFGLGPKGPSIKRECCNLAVVILSYTSGFQRKDKMLNHFLFLESILPPVKLPPTVHHWNRFQNGHLMAFTSNNGGPERRVQVCQMHPQVPPWHSQCHIKLQIVLYVVATHCVSLMWVNEVNKCTFSSKKVLVSKL